MSIWREEIGRAIDAVRFHSAFSFSWFGQRSDWFPASRWRAMTAETRRRVVVSQLARCLYANFYCRGRAEPDAGDWAGETTPEELDELAFVDRLSAANRGGGSWEDGWQIVGRDGDRLVVRRHGVTLRVDRERCDAARCGAVREPGGSARVRLPNELRCFSPGFYVALGNRRLSRSADGEVVRLYWNLEARGAPAFVGSGTEALNARRLPFTLKVLKNADQFVRCDAGVIYLHRSDFASAREPLRDLLRELRPFLRRATPVFTKRLAPGLGLAEDPAGGESFGLHRCTLVAEGLVRADERAARASAERLAIVESCFREAGIELDRAHLDDGSGGDPYELIAVLANPEGTAVGRRATVADADPRSYLEVAARIGRGICREALWDGERCSWMGAQPAATGRDRGSVVYRAIGPQLYSGTSGVALFLATLYERTGNEEYRRTALGAVRQAIAFADSVPEYGRIGLYTGSLGIACVAGYLGRSLGAEDTIDGAGRLLDRAAGERHSRQAFEFDLLAGAAGAVVALLVLSRLLDRRPLELAERFAGELLDAAEWSDFGCSWRSPAAGRRRNLTGLSHGTAGVGAALLELAAETGESTYRECATAAFNYERHHFDPLRRNWPDFRDAGRPRDGRSSLPCETMWCHGAPGIALSRIRAYELFGDEVARREADVALDTTRRAVESWLGPRSANYSLCHGLSGNADVLLDGYRNLDHRDEDVRTVRRVAHLGSTLYAEDGRWPCGALGGVTPDLMLGYAGIGYFYLRLDDPSVPSILLLRPAQWSRQGESAEGLRVASAGA